MSARSWAMVRHGQTEWNRQGLLQGASDIPLNDTGRAQARRAAAKLSIDGVWDVVVCSPLARARETAQIIAAQLGVDEVIEIADLVERDYGPVEGTSVQGLAEGAKRKLMNQGESEQAVIDRGVSVLARLGARYPGRRVVIVSHGSLIRLVRGALTCTNYPRIENGEIVVLEQRLVAERDRNGIAGQYAISERSH